MERASVLALFILLAGATYYIATMGGLGIYYDYRLLPGFPLIAELNQGVLSVAEFQAALESHESHVALFRNIGGLRFHPLYKTDYLFLMNWLGDPQFLWIYRALTFALLGWAIWNLCKHLAGSSAIAVAVIVVVLVPHAGFWYVWTTLSTTTEGQASAAMALALMFYVWFLRRRRIILLAPMALFAGIALCFKEPVFPALGAFAAVHFFLSARRGGPAERIASLVLIGAVGVVSIWYFADEILPFIQTGGASYAEAIARNSGAGDGWALLRQNARAYIASDPGLVFLLFPFLAVQLWRLATGRIQTGRQRLIFAMLVAGAVWFASVLIVGLPPNITFQYFMVPAYCFALPAIAGQVADLVAAVRAKAAFSGIRLAGMLVLVLLTIAPLRTPGQPMAWDMLIGNRLENTNWNLMLDAASDILARNEPQKTYFYFYKSPRSSTVELHESFVTFLVARGFRPNDFDLTYTSAERLNWTPYGRSTDTPATPWSWRRNGVARPIRPGDYLVVNSWWPLNTRDEIDTLLADYDLVYATNGNLDCEMHRPWAELRAYVRTAPLRLLRNAWRHLRGRELLPPSAADGDSRLASCSLFSAWKNFYIFRKT